MKIGIEIDSRVNAEVKESLIPAGGTKEEYPAGKLRQGLPAIS